VTKKRDLLTEACVQKRIVKFWNPFDDGSTTGYVLDMGPRFFLLALIDETIRFNGYQCFRLQDVRRLEAPAGRYWNFQVRGTPA